MQLLWLLNEFDKHQQKLSQLRINVLIHELARIIASRDAGCLQFQ